MIAALPGTEDLSPETVVRTYLFETSLEHSNNQEKLESISAAARSSAPVDRMLPTRKQAAALLDRLIAFGASVQTGSELLSMQTEERLAPSVGRVVGSAVLPSLEIADLTEPRLAFIDFCASLGNGGGALAGLHELVRLLPEKSQKVSADLRRAMARGDIHDVVGASLSIGDWVEAGESGRYPPLPESLKDAVIASLEVGVRQALQPRLWCARRLLRAGALSVLQGETLSRLLPDIWEGLAYETMPWEGPEAIGVTLARGECVRLAAALTTAGHTIDGNIADAADDPLPEVRFAHLNRN